jgi:hypothetical protein
MSDPQFGMFPKDVDSKSGEMSEWSIEHAWKACDSELRGGPDELQIQMVASPRNQISDCVETLWRHAVAPNGPISFPTPVEAVGPCCSSSPPIPS